MTAPVYLVRHGQSEWNVLRLTQGQTHHPRLTALGEAQARAAAEVIATDLVSHGDAIRAALAHLAGIPPQEAPWVEVGNGAVARVEESGSRTVPSCRVCALFFLHSRGVWVGLTSVARIYLASPSR